MISDELLKKINVDFKNGNFRENFKDLIKIFKIQKSSDIANKIGVVLIKLNKKVSYTEVLKSIKKRDKSDFNRKISPLKKTKDSLLINTTNLNKRSCFLKIKKIIDRKINN